MFLNYFKTAWRTTVKNKSYSALNILGLATGMGVALLIGLWVYYQYSYDTFLPGYKQVYQVKRNFYGNGDTMTYGGTSLKLAEALRTSIPEIQYVAETDGFGMHGLMVADKKLYRSGGQVGADFLKIFSYVLKEGRPATVLNNSYSIVLTAPTAKALFGNSSAMGKVVRFDGKHDLTVTGVLETIPSNSTLQFDYLVPFSYWEANDPFIQQARTAGFGWTNFTVYIKLRPDASYGTVARKIRDLQKTATDNPMAMATNIIADPLTNWHLFETFKNGKAVGGFIDYVRIFAIIGILVLIIGCINFINLTTARSEKRAREVGVRKAIGAGRGRLIMQFLSESILLTLIASWVTIFLVQMALPVFNSLTGDSVVIPYTSPLFWLLSSGCVLITGLLAGSRPAFYLSSFEPVKVLKGKVHVGRDAAWPRKVLVVLQFTCSIALIIATSIIYKQLQYAKSRPSGYDKDRLMITAMNADLGSNYTAIRNKMLSDNIATTVTTASASVTNSPNHRDVDDWPGKRPGESVNMGVVTVSNDYFKTLGIGFSEGRDFSSASDTLHVIFNEAAVRLLRLQNPLNQTVTWQDSRLQIIGVVKNALMSSPYSPAEPTIFLYDTRPQDVIMYRLNPHISTQTAVTSLSTIFTSFNPAYPFTYSFADEDYANKFQLELLIGKLAGLFAALAIFISCLGLFGLAAFVAEQRTKEIGVRKVLGASVVQVWLLLSKDFMYLVVISSVIATPISFYYMQNWLEQYDYRVTINPLVFIFAAAAAILVTLFTVSFQAIKAALTNPVKSLRSE